MRISSLTLRDFRNYKELSFTPCEGLNIIFGENAQGKTNLLEAVALLAFGRSHRTPHDSELIRHGETASFAEVLIDDDDKDYKAQRVSVQLSLTGKKILAIDGEKLTRLSELMGCLNVALFSPESLLLVKGGATERRRFLNMEISQLGGSYFYSLQRYNAALKQRNAALKYPEIQRYAEYAHAWDEQLAQQAIPIFKARYMFVERVLPIAQTIFSELSCGEDELDIKYRPSWVKDPFSAEAEEEFLCALKDSLPDDIKRGHTRFGPHRDELFFTVNKLDARMYASQGQQRALALALKLSEITLIEELCRQRPVVLLDDVFSELDAKRCRALLNYIGGRQALITCANSAALDLFLGDAHVFTCKNGVLEH